MKYGKLENNILIDVIEINNIQEQEYDENGLELPLVPIVIPDNYFEICDNDFPPIGNSIGSWELKDNKIYKVWKSEKCLELKQVENSFLQICEQLTGSKNKLGFSELQSNIENLMLINQQEAITLSIKLLTIDASGIRYGGTLWWDDISWHSDI